MAEDKKFSLEGVNAWLKRHKEKGDLDAELERKIKILDRIDKLDDVQLEKFEAFLRQRIYESVPEMVHIQ